MRYLQRMQTGLALAGILLCFTSASFALRVHASHPVADMSTDGKMKTFTNMTGVDMSQEGTFQILHSAGANRLPIVAIQANEPLHKRIAQSLNDAKSTRDKFTASTYIFVVYSKTGLADRLLYVCPDGRFMDVRSRRSFIANDFLKQYVTSIARVKSKQHSMK